MLGRTIALLMVMTLATAMAARQGAIPMAAHQISMQIWLAASLLSDSLALAGQVCYSNNRNVSIFALSIFWHTEENSSKLVNIMQLLLIIQ